MKGQINWVEGHNTHTCSKVCKEQMGTYTKNTLMAERSISVVLRSVRKIRKLRIENIAQNHSEWAYPNQVLDILSIKK